MKRNNAKRIAAALLLLGAGTVHAQWSGTNPITTNSLVDINRIPTCDAALRVHGDVIFKDNCVTADSITFARPFGENGMSLMCQGGQRADVRYNGTTLKLITRASGGAPTPDNGISIDNAGHVGLGISGPQYRLHVVSGGTPNIGAWITSNSFGPALWVRRDATASTGSFPGGMRFALMVENNGTPSDGADLIGGGMFTSRDIALFGWATGNGDHTAEVVGVKGSATGQSLDARAYSAYGVQGDASNAEFTYGVKGTGVGCTQSIGVAGYAQLNQSCATPSSTCYGVYGTTIGPVTPNTFAGYFAGNVFISGSYGPSDRKLKENITDLTNGLATIMKLNPKNYTYSKREELKTLNLPDGINHGFIAQELEEVLPELVKDANSPEIKDKDGKVISKKVEFKGINYVSLIPYLVAGMKEQQAQIEQLKAELAAIKNNTPSNIGQNTGAASQSLLYQNKPNPTDGATVIDYELVNVKTSASITICDLNGKQVKRLPLDIGNSKGSVTIAKGELAPGMYLYSLLTDDAATQALRMIIQ